MAGVTTDVCCASTVSCANDMGFNMIVLKDCMASYDIKRHKATLDIIKAQGGIFGWVSDSKKLLKILIKDYKALKKYGINNFMRQV